MFDRTRSSIDALDGLRAFAILAVLLRHVTRPYADTASGPLLPILGFDLGFDLGTVFLNGWVGVDLFFVLSGFLLTRHLLSVDQASPFWMRYATYIKDRALRIFPAYIAVLGAILLGLFPLYTVSSDDLGFRVLYHLLLMQDILPADINVAFWSLGVEWKFYLIFPFLILLPAGRVRLLVMLALLIAPLIIRLWLSGDHQALMSYPDFFQRLRSPFYACFDGLIVGVVCAFLQQRWGKALFASRPGFWSLVFWVSAGVLLTLLASGPLVDAGVSHRQQVGLQALLALLFGALLLSVVNGGGLASFLAHRVFVIPARLAYTAYLVHMPLIPLSRAMTALLAPTAGPGQSLLICLAITFCLTFFCSLLLHALIEQPFMRLRGVSFIRRKRLQKSASDKVSELVSP